MTIIDPTGVPLTPSYQGKDCLGNGDHRPEYEICCDECGYYLFCFPQYDPASPEFDPTVYGYPKEAAEYLRKTSILCNRAEQRMGKKEKNE